MTDQLRAGLFDTTGPVIVVGLVIVVVALVTGPYGWAVTLRRSIAGLGRTAWHAGGHVAAGAGTVGWIADHRQALQVAGALVVIGVLLLVDVSWASFLVTLTVLAVWELALWRLGAETNSARTASTPTEANG